MQQISISLLACCLLLVVCCLLSVVYCLLLVVPDDVVAAAIVVSGGGGGAVVVDEVRTQPEVRVSAVEGIGLSPLAEAFRFLLFAFIFSSMTIQRIQQPGFFMTILLRIRITTIRGSTGFFG